MRPGSPDFFLGPSLPDPLPSHPTDLSSLTVLITAGGSLSGKALGPAPPLHDHPLWLPAGSGLAIERIARFYAPFPLVKELVVVSDRSGMPSPDLRCMAGVRLLQVVRQHHIGGSIAAALPSVRTPWVLVNPITTLPSHPPGVELELQVGERPLIREDWSALEACPEGGWRFHGKREPLLERGALTHPFTGIFTAPTDLLQQVLEELPDEELEDLLAVAERLHSRHQARIEATTWFDLGHRASLADSRRSRLPSRAFNRLHHCSRRDAIVKLSSDQSRLSAEEAYIKSLPGPLRRHFPALLPPEPGEEGALVMEAIPFPNLAELFLHWRIGPNAWLAILERLASILNEFAAASPPCSGDAGWLYGAKLEQRWEQLCGMGEHLQERWLTRELRINGRWYPSLELIVVEMLEALAPLQHSCRLQLIHGDLCFNNILCDPLYTAVRLIDPRGERSPHAGVPIGVGDSRYDLIKLHHSVAGLYDGTVNNLFRLHREGDDLRLTLYAPPNHAFLRSAFEQRLLAGVPDDERRTLTASLFLSMLPLHAEDPARLLALAATGVLLWHDELAGALTP